MDKSLNAKLIIKPDHCRIAPAVQGLGLGLPLVSTLVWHPGGKVRLANRTDRPGVEVGLILPLASQEVN